MHNRVTRRTLVIFAALLFVSAVACIGDGRLVIVANDTGRSITLFIDESAITDIPPGGTAKVGTGHGTGTWEARDPSGNVLYRRTLTWEDLADGNWHVSITDSRAS